jgi:hypothetical protein
LCTSFAYRDKRVVVSLCVFVRRFTCRTSENNQTLKRSCTGVPSHLVEKYANLCRVAGHIELIQQIIEFAVFAAS